MEDKKTSVLAILRILQEYSDENHILKQPVIKDLMLANYNLKIDRRTIYRNVEMLKDFGFDISDFQENGKGYYLRERDFEPSQIFLLCNAIHSSNFIPSSYSSEIIEKLLETQSKYFRNEYKSTVYVQNYNKKENKDFFLNIEVISNAIKNRNTISFNYTKYDINKNLINRRNEKYVVSPYYIVYINEKTYLVCKSANHDNFIHFRVDRMKNVSVAQDRYIRLATTEDPYQYAKTQINMFTGQQVNAVIKCDNIILDNIVDLFGKDVTLEQVDDDHFLAYLTQTDRSMFYLALQYIDHMEIVNPTSLREEIKAYLQKALENYQK